MNRTSSKSIKITDTMTDKDDILIKSLFHTRMNPLNIIEHEQRKKLDKFITSIQKLHEILVIIQNSIHHTNYTIWSERSNYLENVMASLSEVYKQELVKEIKMKMEETGKILDVFPTWQQIVEEYNLEQEEKNRRYSSSHIKKENQERIFAITRYKPEISQIIDQLHEQVQFFKYRITLKIPLGVEKVLKRYEQVEDSGEMSSLSQGRIMESSRVMRYEDKITLHYRDVFPNPLQSHSFTLPVISAIGKIRPNSKKRNSSKNAHLPQNTQQSQITQKLNSRRQELF